MAKTGNVATIFGIECEEFTVVLSGRNPSIGDGGGEIREEKHCWIPRADEFRRVPALRELAEYARWEQRILDSARRLRETLSRLLPDQETREAAQMMAAIDGSFFLKMHSLTYAPALAKIMQSLPAAFPGVDISAPIADLETIVTDISTDPVPDAAFQAPAGYAPAPFREIASALPQAALPTLSTQGQSKDTQNRTIPQQ